MEDKLPHNFWDKLINKKIKTLFNDTQCGLVIGDRGSGKSTFFSLIANEARKQELTVYSNYPIKDVFSIPQIETVRKDGSKRIRLDKDWLYTTDLTNSIIMSNKVKKLFILPSPVIISPGVPNRSSFI